MKRNNTADRMPELDALRGLSAIGVLLFHYTSLSYIYFSSHPLFYIPWIPYRLQFFALISGFVIPMVLDKTGSPLDFAVARFSRLYPCYFIAVVFNGLLLTHFQAPSKKLVMTWPVFLANLTMLQAWLGFDNIDAAFWFLSPELAFYVIVFVFLLFNKMKYIEVVGLGGLILVVLNARYGSFGPISIPAVIIYSKMLCFWEYFLAGILFYNLKSKGDVWWRHAGLALCFIVQNIISDDIYSILCFSFCLLVFYSFIYGKLYWIAQKPLLFLGTISYSLYLIHQNMGLIIIRYLYKAGMNEWLRLIIPTAISIVAATLMTYLIERPATKCIRIKYAQWRQNR
jgi:peptidoglycan/LPS O-acetylase OafA/YrhL